MPQRNDDQEIGPFEKLLALLACPACQGDVQIKEDKIICTCCQRSYPIVDGIPVLLVDQSDL